MNLHRQAFTDLSVTQPEPPSPLSVHTALGTRPCNGIGCASQIGIACAYVDRRGRPCPTAWCPNHRTVFEDTVYCALHGATLTGLHWDFGDSPHPDVDNRVPALVAWISRVAEDDIVATLQSICRARNEVLVRDPVRRVFLGPQRDRSWERAWKTCSAFGVATRVVIAVEEANPNLVLAKVNSKIVATLAAPAGDLAGQPPAEVVELLFRELVMPMSFALDSLQQGMPLEARAMGGGAPRWSAAETTTAAITGRYLAGTYAS